MTLEVPKPTTLSVTNDKGTLSIKDLPEIPLQTGIRPDRARNGYLDTEILEGIATHLDSFRDGPMWSSETEEAVTLIRAGIKALRDRVARRKREGVYGQNVETSTTQN